jgi:hypothetical protein
MSYEGNPFGLQEPIRKEPSQKDLKEAAEERGDKEMELLVQKAYGGKK